MASVWPCRRQGAMFLRTPHIMADMLFIVVTIASFVALAAFVYACYRV